jgi:diacylglycerol O-acyltransferase
MVNGMTWGGPAEMSAWEALMWRAEIDPRTRSTGILLEILDAEPDWADVRAAMARAVDQVPRLRDRVVVPPITALQPFWSPHPQFDLDDHVRTEALDAPHDLPALMRFCDRLVAAPLDQSRAPWEAVLVTGLSGGRAAFALKIHHSISDGQGLMQLLSLIHDNDPTAPAPVAGLPATSGVPLVRKVGADVTRLPGAAAKLALRGVFVAARVASAPRKSLSKTLTFASSLGRMLAPVPVGRSPLLRSGGAGAKFFTFDVPLSDLKQAGKSGGGSINDAFVAAALGGFRLYHQHHGVRRDRIPVSMPVSLRKENDPGGGNRFAGIRFAGPMSETDPAARIVDIGQQVEVLRREPALAFLDHLAPTLTKLPTSAIVELSASLTSSVDLQISNIRGVDEPLELAGAPVVGLYPLGPRPGVAAMVTMITYAGICCIGVNVDPVAVADPDVFEACLKDGFAEVLALASAGSDKDLR